MSAIEVSCSKAKPARSFPPQGKTGDPLRAPIAGFASVAFQRLAPRSQRVQRAILEKTLGEPIAPGRTETFAAFPLGRMTRSAIRVLRDRVPVDTPEAANNRVKAVRRLFNWASENELVKANPARGVKYISTGSQGFHTWTTDEVEQFEARHAIGSKARLALAMLLYTGVRRSDAVLLGRQHVRSGSLKFTQQKNRLRRPVTSPSALQDLATGSAIVAMKPDCRTAQRMACAKLAPPSLPRKARRLMS